MGGFLKLVREHSPLVHHITNYVTMNDCANATLAIGGSPVMTASPDEAAEMASIASALVLNMGTCDEDQYRAMAEASGTARKRGIPVVFDPVGAGATAFRRRYALRVMEELAPDLVKGNAAELSFLAGSASEQRGVDSTGSATRDALLAVRERYRCVAVATGPVDLACGEGGLVYVRGGNEELGRVCGTGCMSASVLACLAAVSAGNYLEAAVSCSLLMKLAGEEAQRRRMLKDGGLSSFRWALMDELGRVDDEIGRAHV